MDLMQRQAEALKAARRRAGLSASQLADEIIALSETCSDPITLTQQAISFFENGKAKSPPRWLRYARTVLEDRGALPTGDVDLLTGPEGRDFGTRAEHLTGETNHPSEGAVLAPSTKEVADQLDLVTIEQIDLAYGLGATFADGPIGSELMHFPRQWVDAITSSPPALLTWTRGRGDSMLPTIDDGDLILLDRSQRRVTEQDALWAFTVGDLAAIKRLRIKGDRVVVLSDNPAVPPDEEPIDEVNIVARVVFVGRKI